jgi:hypothetical protein
MSTVGETSRVDWLAKGAYGWALDWAIALQIANVAAGSYGKRHRVYWSCEGRCWMIRRAYER